MCRAYIYNCGKLTRARGDLDVISMGGNFETHGKRWAHCLGVMSNMRLSRHAIKRRLIKKRVREGMCL